MTSVFIRSESAILSPQRNSCPHKLSLGLNLMGSCLLFHKLLFPQNPEEMCSGKPLQHRILGTEQINTSKSIFVSKDYHWHANIYCSGRFQPLWEQRPQKGKRASNSPSELTVSQISGWFSSSLHL